MKKLRYLTKCVLTLSLTFPAYCSYVDINELNVQLIQGTSSSDDDVPNSADDFDAFLTSWWVEAEDHSEIDDHPLGAEEHNPMMLAVISPAAASVDGAANEVSVFEVPAAPVANAPAAPQVAHAPATASVDDAAYEVAIFEVPAALPQAPEVDAHAAAPATNVTAASPPAEGAAVVIAPAATNKLVMQTKDQLYAFMSTQNPIINILDLRQFDLSQMNELELRKLFTLTANKDTLFEIHLGSFKRWEMGRLDDEQEVVRLVTKFRGLSEFFSQWMQDFSLLNNRCFFYQGLKQNTHTLHTLELYGAKAISKDEYGFIECLKSLINLRYISVLRTEMSNNGILAFAQTLREKVNLVTVKSDMPYDLFSSVVYSDTCAALSGIYSLKELTLHLRDYFNTQDWIRSELWKYRNSPWFYGQGVNKVYTSTPSMFEIHFLN
jgi:hypothetical protein